MKRNAIIGLAVAALLIATQLSSANAADMAIKAPPPAPAPAPTCMWCGWYLGLNAGWLRSTHNTITNTGTDTGGGGFGAALGLGLIPASIGDSYSGFLGGGQIGYNWQTGIMVIGLEGDIDGLSGARGGNSFASSFITTTYTRSIDWLSTVRGRIGITLLPQVLAYGTGGLAFGETKIGNAASCPTAFPPCSSEPTTTNTSTNTSTGWTAGAGLEWLFAPRWSIKAEYLYVDLGSHNTTIAYAYPPANTSSVTSTVRDTANIVRGGINYHF
jgi:outer membrane immunogenic protein